MLSALKEPVGDTPVPRASDDARVDGRLLQNTHPGDGASSPFGPEGLVPLYFPGFEPPVPPPQGPDPIWGDRFQILPKELDVDRAESEARADGAECPAHPDPERGRRPSDPTDTEHLRVQYLSQVNALQLQEIFSKMFKCGFHLMKCKKCALLHFLPRKCGSRLCPFDARRRATERAAIYSGLSKKSKNPRFLTLTQPLVPYEEADGLLNGIKRLRKAIARLIRRKVFNQVWGGIYSFEIVLRPGGFHIHAHLLLDCLWIENRNEKGRPLETAWRECLEGVGTVFGESSHGRSIVWVVKCEEKTIREVLKYTVKGASVDDSEAPPEGGSLVHTGSKIYNQDQLRWDEVPFEGLKQLVEVVEGRVHLIEPIKKWRGAIGQFRKQQEEMTRQRAWELNFCACGGELIDLTSGPWADPRLVFVDGKHELREPPPESSMPSYWLRKKAE